MSLNEILREAVQREASDVLLIAGLPVSYKVNGHICREGERLFPEHTRVLVEELSLIHILHHQGRNSKALTRYTAGVPPIFRCKNDQNSCFPLFPLISEKKMLPSGR